MWNALLFRNLKRYFFASLINTIIGIFAILFVYKITNQRYLTILICSLIGYFYSIFTYHRIAFHGNLADPPYLKYAVTYASSFLLNSIFTNIGAKYIDQFTIIQLVVVPLVVIIQWLAANLWVFKAKK